MKVVVLSNQLPELNPQFMDVCMDVYRGILFQSKRDCTVQNIIVMFHYVKGSI